MNGSLLLRHPVPNLVAIGLSVTKNRDLSVFIMAAAMLNFKKFEILTAGMVRRVNLRHYTKFYFDRSNLYRDIAIFRLSRQWPSAILVS